MFPTKAKRASEQKRREEKRREEKRRDAGWSSVKARPRRDIGRLELRGKERKGKEKICARDGHHCGVGDVKSDKRQHEEAIRREERRRKANTQRTKRKRKGTERGRVSWCAGSRTLFVRCGLGK